MRTSAFTITLLLFATDPAQGADSDLDSLVGLCSSIGFKKGTQSHGECVLELDRRVTKTVSVGERSNSALVTTVPQGDGSEDDQQCQRFGFKVGAADYGSCRMNFAAVRSNEEQKIQQYQQQQREYEAKVAEARSEEKRQEYLRKARCHFSSAAAASQPGSTNSQGLLNLLACEAGATGPISVPTPSPPPTPMPSSFHINTPNGTVYCNTMGNSITCR
jgi:hypothetical protein